jgi:hypothetical protein
MNIFGESQLGSIWGGGSGCDVATVTVMPIVTTLHMRGNATSA